MKHPTLREARARAQRDYLAALWAEVTTVEVAAKIAGVSRATMYRMFDQAGVRKVSDKKRLDYLGFDCARQAVSASLPSDLGRTAR